MKNHIFQIYSITSNTLFYMNKIVMKIFPKANITNASLYELHELFQHLY